jgi:hypothetical protein
MWTVPFAYVVSIVGDVMRTVGSVSYLVFVGQPARHSDAQTRIKS